MKSICFKKILALCLLAAVLLLTAACNAGRVDDTGSATVVVAVGDEVDEYEVPLSEVDGSRGAFGLLDYLASEGKLTYTAEDSGYGAYLTRVGELCEDADAGVYIGIWTSVESDMDRESVYSTTVNYGGIELVSAAVGISSMSVPDGATVYFGELKY